MPKVTFCQDQGTWGRGQRWGEIETLGWACQKQEKKMGSSLALGERSLLITGVNVNFKFIIVFVSNVCLSSKTGIPGIHDLGVISLLKG